MVEVANLLGPDRVACRIVESFFGVETREGPPTGSVAEDLQNRAVTSSCPPKWRARFF